MSNKQRYKAFCETEEHQIPLFLQYWWMETVCKGKEWDVALAEEKGVILGALPYLKGRKMGMSYVLQPQLTQFSGPFYNYPSTCTSSQSRLSFEKKVASLLIQKLQEENLAYYCQNFSPQITNWLPFHWAGFQQTTRYTYKIPSLENLDEVFARFDRNERQKKILRLQDNYTLSTQITPEFFARFHVDYWKGRGENDLLSREFMEHLITESLQRNHGQLLALKDKEGAVVAVRFVVYDSQCAYSLLSAYDEHKYVNGLTELLVWETIRFMASFTRSYDFEGSMDEGIEYFYRSFGAEQTPYFQVSKCSNPLFKILLWIKSKKS